MKHFTCLVKWSISVAFKWMLQRRLDYFCQSFTSLPYQMKQFRLVCAGLSYHEPEPGHLRCWHVLCPADLNCKQQRPAGRQLQEQPLTTAEKYVRAHLSQPKVCGCLPSLYRSLLSVSKQLWNPTAAVLNFQNMPTTFPLVPASEVFGPQTPSSQPDPWVKLTDTPFYTTLWMGGIVCISNIKESQQQLCVLPLLQNLAHLNFRLQNSVRKRRDMLLTPNNNNNNKSLLANTQRGKVVYESIRVARKIQFVKIPCYSKVYPSGDCVWHLLHHFWHLKTQLRQGGSENSH